MTTSNLRIEQRAPQPAICIETTTADVGKALAEALPAAFEWVAAHGGTVAGAPFTRYLEISEDPPSYRIEAGVPTAVAMATEGRMKAIILPGGDLAVGDHHGPYHTVVETAVALREYIEAQGRAASGPLWENYITDPGAEPDPEKFHTEVCYPLT